MSVKTIAFFPHNQTHIEAFVKVGKYLREKSGLEVVFIHELGEINGEKVFQFDVAISEVWADVDTSYNSLSKLEEKYPECNLIRALFSERRLNYFPQYLNYKRISYESQLRYTVACFQVFEEWIARNRPSCIISELLIGLPDSIVFAVCQKNGVRFISIRSAKMLPGLITCSPEIDIPTGMMDMYQQFIQDGIPEEMSDLAQSHLEEVRTKITTPNYMQITKNDFRLATKQRLINLILGLGKKRVPTCNVSLSKHPLWESILRIIQRFCNIISTRKNETVWFCGKIPDGEKYFVFPLQYEPEATTLVRAFPFSDQMCVIQQIAKALPLGVTLAVKEHRGNHGYRKASSYKELYYLPNIRLIPREADVDTLIANSIGVITLNSRMGWEALVLKKPVIAFGIGFWTEFSEVKKPGSWIELKQMLVECLFSTNEDDEDDYEKELLAYAAAYISLTHEGSFIVATDYFMSEPNIKDIANLVSISL